MSEMLLKNKRPGGLRRVFIRCAMYSDQRQRALECDLESGQQTKTAKVAGALMSM